MLSMSTSRDKIILNMSKKVSKKSYHHGNLKQALLSEAEHLLETEGLPSLSLRAIARAANVSHAAPKNHFGDLTGLLNELAIKGHLEIQAVLTKKLKAEIDRDERLKAIGLGYIRFASKHPGLFTLMFRSELLDGSRAGLKEALIETRNALRRAVALENSDDSSAVARATAFWSMIHGYATLMSEGRLKGTLASLPKETPESFFEKVLACVTWC